MAILHVEKFGGIANIGGSRSHIRSRGQLDTSSLSKKDMQTVESLFKKTSKPKTSQINDGFRFAITRTTATGTEVIEVPESLVPAVVAACVKDELV